MFVREDLSLPQIAVQSCHACIEATKAFGFDQLGDHPNVILIGIRDECELHRVRTQLAEQEVRCVAFYESDIGEQMTALATEAVPASGRRPFRKYRLLKCR